MDNSTSFHDYFFGPLGKNYCLYFYFIALFWLISMALMVVSGLIGLLKVKKFDFALFLAFSILFLIKFILYIQSRLLYNMCYNSEISKQ